MLSKDFDDIVEVVIGKDGIKFRAHAYKLSQASGFFKAACSVLWECGRTRTITLDDQDPDIFAIFASWLLNGDLSKASSFVELASEGDARETSLRQRWTQLCQCYVLGDFLQAPDFKNTVIDHLLLNKRLQAEETNKISGTRPMDIKMVWANTIPGSPLRQMILDHSVSNGKGQSLATQAPCVEFHEYFCELASLFQEKRSQGRGSVKPWEKDICCYHEHPEGWRQCSS